MRRRRASRTVPALVVSAVLFAAACSDGDGRELCEDREAIVGALDRVAQGPAAGSADAIRDAATRLRATEVDDALRSDVDLLADYLEVVADVSGSDLDDPREVASLERQVTRLEAQIDRARQAAAAVRAALDACPA